MQPLRVDQLPGFRRRFRITPLPGRVCAEVEDDFHCMTVTVFHDDITAMSVDAKMHRAPWTTCPGAMDKCRRTFEGVALADFTVLKMQLTNCTHLYDLGLLAAVHALDDSAIEFDILVSDPQDGMRQAEIRRNGVLELSWIEVNSIFVAPPELAGLAFKDMRPWMETLDPQQVEAARLLRWGSLIAHGRTIPMDQQSNATRMPANCYTFQPERAIHAERVGRIIDFSDTGNQPLQKNKDVL